MFYSQDILQKRGKFGIVWIAATKPVKLTRREYSSVNVMRTCDDIIQYILLRAQPIRPGGGRPRLSLYLSSQLMYGTVVVFGKQQMYLFNDVNTLSNRFQAQAKTESSDKIDLPLLPRGDPHFILEEMHDNQIFNDFGCFSSPSIVLPREIPDVDVWKMKDSTRAPRLGSQSFEIGSSPQKDLPFPIPTEPMLFQPGFDSLQAKPEEITLLEPIASPILPVPYLLPGEPDLPPLVELGEKDISDGFSSDVQPPEDIEQVRDRSALSPIFERDPQTQVSIFQPTDLDEYQLPPAEETPAVMVEADIPPATPKRISQPELPLDITPPAELLLQKKARKRSNLVLELSPLLESPVHKRKRRQLAFADIEIQLSREQLKRNLSSGVDTCKELELAGVKQMTANELFTTVTLPGLKNKRFQRLWKRNTLTRSFPETDSDAALPSWTVPGLRYGSTTTSSSDNDRSSPHSEKTIRSNGHSRHEFSDDMIPEEEIPRAEVTTELERDASSLYDRSKVGDLSSVHSTSRHGESDLHLSILSKSLEKLANISSDYDQPPHRKIPRLTIEETEFPELEVLPYITEELNLRDSWSDINTSLDKDKSGSANKADIYLETVQQLVHTVSVHTADDKWTTFRRICSPESRNKREGSTYFCALLDLIGQKQICVKQKKCYADIFIAKGEKWRQ